MGHLPVILDVRIPGIRPPLRTSTLSGCSHRDRGDHGGHRDDSPQVMVRRN